ncbi:MAG: dUTP diphosphatase [Treponema sp.]|nr:dUTP diphosphatase [Treponema sp.]
MSIVVKCICADGAKMPAYQTAGSAGADVCARVDKDIVIHHGEHVLVPTGLSFEIPFGYEIQVRPRSGLAAKFGVTVLNAPGTIDSDYRGEVKVILINHGKDDFVIHDGDRIAQLVIASVVQASFVSVDSISDTERGVGGFGSTGGIKQ